MLIASGGSVLHAEYMPDRKTVKLPEDDFERHRERKEQLGLSWPEYIDGQTPEVKPLSEEDVRAIVRSEIRDAFEEYAR